MIGVEFVESKDTREPLAREKFQQIFNKSKDHGVLFGCGGHHANVSSCASIDNAYYSIAAIEKLWMSMCQSYWICFRCYV